MGQTLAQFQTQVAATLTKEDAEIWLDQLSQIVHEFQGIQQQIIINKSDWPSVAEVTAKLEFEEKSLAIKAMLKRIINASKDGSIDVNLPESDNVLMQLLQRQMALMERHEASGALQAWTTFDTLQEAEVDDLLEAFLWIQTEILQGISDGTTELQCYWRKQS